MTTEMMISDLLGASTFLEACNKEAFCKVIAVQKKAALFIENEQSRIYKLQSEVVRLTLENERLKQRGKFIRKHSTENFVYIGARGSGKSIAMLNMFDRLYDELLKNFAIFLIDKSENGIISISDLPDFLREWVMRSDR